MATRKKTPALKPARPTIKPIKPPKSVNLMMVRFLVGSQVWSINLYDKSGGQRSELKVTDDSPLAEADRWLKGEGYKADWSKTPNGHYVGDATAI